jgi:hypothetical protein
MEKHAGIQGIGKKRLDFPKDLSYNRTGRGI